MDRQVVMNHDPRSFRREAIVNQSRTVWSDSEVRVSYGPNHIPFRLLRLTWDIFSNLFVRTVNIPQNIQVIGHIRNIDTFNLSRHLRLVSVAWEAIILMSFATGVVGQGWGRAN